MSVTSRRNRLVRLAPQKRNGRTLLDTNERLRFLLQQVTEAVHSTLDLEEVFKRITDGAVSSLGYTIAFVAVLNSEKQCFEIKALSTQKRLLPQIKKILGFPLAGLSVPADPELNATIRSVAEGRVVVVKTLAEIAYPVISKEVCSALQKFGRSKNYIMVPLQNRGGVAGAVYVSSPREEVSEEELAVLQNFAWSASQAIRNANLYTRTKQAQEQLQESEENLRTYLENAPDGVYLNDLKGNFLYGNKKAEEILGYKREELIGKGFLKLDILPAKYLAKADKLLALNAIGRPNGPDEFELTRKDGSPRWVEISTAPIKQGGETVVIGFVRDITERKRGEETLRKSMIRYEELAESIGDAFYVFDSELRYTYWNRASEELTGISAKDALGKHLHDIFPKDEQTKKAEGVYLKVLKGKQPQHFVNEYQLKDKHSFFEISAYPTKDGLSVFARDISERKQAEEALRESEENLRTYLENAPDGVYLNDLKGNFLYGNKKAEEILGYKREELIGKSFLELNILPAKYLAKAGKLMALNAIGRPTGLDEFELTRKDGSPRWVEISTAPIKQGGETVVIGFVRDITERKEAEELYTTLDNSSPASIYIGQDNKFTYVNPAFQEASGYTKDELLGRDLSTIVHLDDREKVRQNVVQMLKGERLQPYEFRFITKSGETGWALERVTPITYAGRPAILGVCINITEHKQAEEALRQSEGKYAALVEKGNDGIIIIQDGVLKFVNSKMLEMTGFSMNETLGRAFLDFVSPESRGSVADRYRRRIAGESVSDKYEIEILSRDGEKMPVEINASIIEYEGRPADMAIIRDITERKGAEELYATLANSSPVGIYIALDDRFVFANAMMQKNTGYTEEELLGKDTLSIIHPEDKKSARENAIEMLKGKRTQPYEFRYLTKTGETRWALGRMTSITYQGRQAILGVSINITEYKQSELLYHTLADSSPVGVYLLQDGKFVFTNPAFQEATGFTDDDLLGRDAPRIVHPEDRQRVMKNAIEMVKGERLQPYEFRYITKIGETKWALERTASITYQGRRASLANFLDVTESKQAQERIERAAEEWRTTFDSITDFISIHDKDNRIVRMNKALADALKTTPKELIGKVCHEVMHGTKEPPANCPQRQTLRSGKPATIEMFEPSLGIWIQESTSPIFDEKGEVTGSVHIVRDMSDQKRMEEQLVMTDRLASIGELASGIAHELNNPLTSVIGFSQLLMEGNVPDNIKEDLGTVYSEAQRAAAIVKNLLTFARKHTPVKQLSQVNAVIEDVLRLRAYEQKVNNIEVERRLATGLPEIMVDNFQMQQAFLNIIVNAEFAMLEAHGKGKLVITTERVNGVIKVTFTDDGPGIAKENMRFIFSPFFTTKEVGKGTGLGLSICHGIVSEHGGRIYAESELGRGATFVVELPLNGH